MKNKVWNLLILTIILSGISLILFVLRIVWNSPDPMGMMMGANMMYHHMGNWLRGMVIFFVVFIIILVIILIIINPKKK